MKVFNWLANCFSNRGKAMFRRGMARAKTRNHQGAIEDYTTVIGIPDMPAELMAMVLYNRALVYVAAGDGQKGADDLDAVLAMDEALVNVKTMARRKLARMESRASKSNV